MAPLDAACSSEADFWDVDDDDDCDEMTWIANMSKVFPPGSLLDQTGRPVSSVDVRDFDTLDQISDYIETPSGSILDLPLSFEDVDQDFNLERQPQNR